MFELEKMQNIQTFRTQETIRQLNQIRTKSLIIFSIYQFGKGYIATCCYVEKGGKLNFCDQYTISPSLQTVKNTIPYQELGLVPMPPTQNDDSRLIITYI